MSTRAWRWSRTLLVAAFVGAAWLAACAEPQPARFPHRKHLSELSCGGPGQPACLTCNTCHAVSHAERALKLPSASTCDACHKRDRARAHETLGLRPPRPHGEISIDHALHLAMPEIGGQCVKCHAGVFQPGQSDLPPMSQCFGCHEHERQWQGAQCEPCHRQSDLRRTAPVSFLAHDATFMRRHGQQPAFERSLCQSCHEQRDCQSCHDVNQDLTAEVRAPERLDGAFVHRGDFMSRHAIEAQSGPTRCLSCHTVQSCDGCHAARGVSGNSMQGRSVHPPGWVGNSPAIPSLHGTAARRDIVSCAGCHDQGPATNCIRCHKVGGYGGNPHPTGWQSARGPSAEMCRYCHG